MTDNLMAELLGNADLAIEINTDPKLDMLCTDCGGGLYPFGDIRLIAPTLALGTPDAGRICETCCDKRKPGFWEIATGLDTVFDGLMRLPQDERALMAAGIGEFVVKLAQFN